MECPLAGSIGEAANLEHYPCPNEWSFTMCDPDFYLYYCRLPKPQPWSLVQNFTIALSRCQADDEAPRKSDYDPPASVIMPSLSPPIRR